MPSTNVRILLVESDPEICDLISRQALQPLGYQVLVVSEASKAIQQVIKFTPDLIISNINLLGLNGKDLMVVLTSQSMQTPLIVIAVKGQEMDVIEALRLGADYYLLWPARDIEVVSLVERSLSQVRVSHNCQRPDIKLKEVNQVSERRVCELTTIFAVGKAVLSIWDQSALLDKSIDTESQPLAPFGIGE